MNDSAPLFLLEAQHKECPTPCVTDAEREFLIRRAGRMMRLAMARYERSGCFSDRGLADYWLMTMQADIRARSPAQVARMEAARGLESPRRAGSQVG